MLRSARAATSTILIGVLAIQAACVRSMGPPAPLRPGDPTQVCAIRRADRVQASTLDGQEYRLNNASLEGRHLTGEALGRSAKGARQGAVAIPVDSIADVQLFKRSGAGFGLLILGTVVGALGFVGAVAASY